MPKTKQFGKDEFAQARAQNPMSKALTTFIGATKNLGGRLYIDEHDAYVAGQQAAQSVENPNPSRPDLKSVYETLRGFTGVAKDAARLGAACALRKHYNRSIFNGLVEASKAA